MDKANGYYAMMREYVLGLRVPSKVVHAWRYILGIVVNGSEKRVGNPVYVSSPLWRNKIEKSNSPDIRN